MSNSHQLDAIRYMTTFDQNNTGFGMSFDNQNNPTTNFCKRYRASIMQTKKLQAEMTHLPSPFEELRQASDVYMQKHPVIEITMSNYNLETLISDFRELTKLQQFLRINPKMMEEYYKWLTWEGLKK